MVGIIIFGILIAIASIALLISSISIWWLGIELHFLCLRLENHPVLKAMVDDVLQAICNEEGLQVFHKTFEEMNTKEICEAEKAVGLYVYTHNKEWLARAKQRLLRLEELEAEYKMPYKDICASVGTKTDITKEDFTLPRILVVFLSHFPIDKFGLAEKYMHYIKGKGLKDFVNKNKWKNQLVHVPVQKNEINHYDILEGGFTAYIYAVTDNTLHLLIMYIAYILIY